MVAERPGRANSGRTGTSPATFGVEVKADLDGPNSDIGTYSFDACCDRFFDNMLEIKNPTCIDQEDERKEPSASTIRAQGRLSSIVGDEIAGRYGFYQCEEHQQGGYGGELVQVGEVVEWRKHVRHRELKGDER